MRFKEILCVFAAVLLLAACETAPEESTMATGEGEEMQPKEEQMVEKEMTPEMEGPAPGTQEELTRDYGDRVFFDFDKSDLKPEGRGTIEGWAEWMRKYPSKTLTVEGHCDERGTREYNLALGERRATSAKNYLVALGIDLNRVSTISYGKERPAVLGSNDWAWAQNRRTVAAVN